LNTSERTPQRTRIPKTQVIYFVQSSPPMLSITKQADTVLFDDGFSTV